jgi:hypothetical protein
VPRYIYITLSFRFLVALHNIITEKYYPQKMSSVSPCVRLLCLVAIQKGKLEDDTLDVWIERLELYKKETIFPKYN